MSTLFNLNKSDFAKGLWLSVCTAFIASAYQVLSLNTFDFTWVFFKPVLQATLFAFFGYLAKNLSTNSEGNILKREGSSILKDNIITKAWEFLKTWNEITGLGIAAILLFFAVPVVRQIDPSSGVYDGGYFLKPLMTIIFFLTYHAIVWIMIRITFPEVYRFLENSFENIITGQSELTVWQKTLVALVLFCSYFLILAMVSFSL